MLKRPAERILRGWRESPAGWQRSASATRAILPFDAQAHVIATKQAPETTQGQRWLALWLDVGVSRKRCTLGANGCPWTRASTRADSAQVRDSPGSSGR